MMSVYYENAVQETYKNLSTYIPPDDEESKDEDNINIMDLTEDQKMVQNQLYNMNEVHL